MIDYKANSLRFINILRSTKRNGIENVLKELDSLGFFVAPASAGFHLNTIGGLVQHSLNVYDIAMAVKPSLVAIDQSEDSMLPLFTHAPTILPLSLRMSASHVCPKSDPALAFSSQFISKSANRKIRH